MNLAEFVPLNDIRNQMKSHEKLFFEILQNGLWGKQIEVVPTRSDVLQVIRMSLSQTVLGIVGNVIIENETLSSNLTERELASLRKYVMSVVSVSYTWNCNARHIVKEMHENGVEPLLLKGQGIAQYYPNPDLRQCGDIDLYVGKQYFDKACKVIKSLATERDMRTVKDTKKHFHIYLGKVPVELHLYSDVYYPERLDRIYQEISDAGISVAPVEVDIVGYPIKTPSLNFNVFYIFNHLWHHFIADGVGLRQICDLCVLLHRFHGQIDYDYLRNVLEKMGLMKQWKIFGYIAVDKLGLPVEEYPFYDKKYSRLKEKVFRLVMLEVNFGHENVKQQNRPKGYVRGKLYSLTVRAKRNMRVLFLFPKDSLRHIGKVVDKGILAVLVDIFGKKQ